MRGLTILAVIMLTVFAVVPRAEATATACFDWSCHDGDTCDFDASCSTGTPYIWKYKWIYGDGTSSGLTGNAILTHVYTNGACYPTITLYVYDWDGDVQQVTCQIVLKNCVGPPVALSGRCSQ